MTAGLTALLVILAAALAVTFAMARLTMRKLAAGAFDVPLFTEAAAKIEERELALQTTIGTLERQHAIDLEILNGLGEGVLAIDRESRVVLANRRLREIFGFEAIPGMPVHDIVRVVAVFETLDRALRGEETTGRFSTRSGNVQRTIDMRALPVDAPEVAVIAVFTDVTHVSRLEVIRRDFIADFSHEVRTPLAGLRSAVDTHERLSHLNEDDEKQLRRIMSRQLSRLERLVDDLSELSRIESGDLPLARERVDLRTLLDELCEDFAERAAQHGIEIVVAGDGVVISADPVRLQQAFSNLIDNAIKYGGDRKRIGISTDQRDGAAEVRIRDHGDGIPANEKENIFRRFYRIDKSRSQKTGGIGLGLAITKHIILQHHGTIEVESEIGDGATFVVRLPS